MRRYPAPPVPLLHQIRRPYPGDVTAPRPGDHSLEVDVYPDDVVPAAGKLRPLQEDTIDHEDCVFVDRPPLLRQRDVVERIEDPGPAAPISSGPERFEQQIAKRRVVIAFVIVTFRRIAARRRAWTVP